MEVHFSPEQEAELLRAAVREGLAQADRAEFIENEEVLGWLDNNSPLDSY